MANHCYNYVSGSGSEKDLTRLQAIVTILSKEGDSVGSYVSCWSGIYPKFFPEVDGKEEDPDDTKSWGVYQDWGSKWFEAEFDIDPEDGSLTICGDSAWSPVIPFFIKLAQEFKLEFEGFYEEGGMDFAGEFTIDAKGSFNEVQMSHREFQQKHNPECFWDDIINWIDDGHYKTLEDILVEFKDDYWGPLTEEEKDELKKALDEFLASEKERLDGEKTN